MKRERQLLLRNHVSFVVF